ncbi:hypothetical protein [Solimicrobium silvestre]|uniref:Lipoprotein n=1 Tax=Solimicrobium silvestre TaxID=2099400 RepID=A0A2S9H2M9_9BURK|nr:hypothetical protein [Solimicrobium silvestre]PRC94245.1 hypothetical protein S2091_0866 [Solimicrobium silvestre]
MTKVFFPVILLLTVASCATDSPQVAGPVSTQDRLGKAFVSPLNDLNIVQTTIPPVITEALKNPYQIPANISCKTIAEQVRLLDIALGADLDAIVVTESTTQLEQGGAFAQDEAVGSIERTIQGVIPFRSWIRKFSGAEKRSKELTAAIAAGVVRRAFLKGMGQERRCEPPAAPLKRPAVVPASATTTPATPPVKPPTLTVK